jgi:hypothetical protein
MYTREQIEKLSDEKFVRFFGIKKSVFDLMLQILQKNELPVNPKGGRPRRLNTFEKLVIMLEYYHDYLPMRKLAFQWNVDKSQICDAVSWVEKTVIKDGSLSLPSKRKLLETDSELSYVVVDATECRTERPKKNRN